MASVLFLLNGAFNILWSVLYFKLHRPDWSMIEAVFYGHRSPPLLGDDSGIEPSGVVDGPLFSVGLDCNGPELGNDSPQRAVCLSGIDHR